MTPFPGWAAAPACAGTAILIHVETGTRTFTGRLLSRKPIVLLGLISYSLYLWHWPILAFARYAHIEPLSAWQRISLVSGAAFLAIFSWHLVEKPFRTAPTPGSWRPAFARAGVLTVLLVACGGLYFGSSGMPWRISREILAVVDDRQYLASAWQCHMVHTRKADKLCVRGARTTPAFLLVGDSHAAAASGSVFTAAEQAGLAGYQLTEPGYVPTFGYARSGQETGYNALNDRLIGELDRDPGVKLIVVIAYWAQAISENRYYGTGGDLVFGHEAVSRGIGGLARRYPDRTFLLMTAPPHSDLFGAHVLGREMLFDRFLNTDLSISAYHQANLPYQKVFRNLSTLPNLEFIDVETSLCSRNVCPSRLPDGTLMYRDGNHLTARAANRLTPLFREFFVAWKGKGN